MPEPVRTQVSGHMGVSVSDCQYPRLAAWSGTRRARPPPLLDWPAHLTGDGPRPVRAGLLPCPWSL